MSLIATSFLRKELIKSINLCRYGAMGVSKAHLNRCFSTSTTLQSLSSIARTPKFQSFIKMLSLGIGLGTLGSGTYIYSIVKTNDNVAIPNSLSGDEYFLQESPPQNLVSRSVQSPGDGSGFKITLYQYQTCPFCCKVRAFLDYYGFSYDVVEVNPLSRKETKWNDYKKVPALVIEQQGVQTVMQLKDSSMIISALQSFIANRQQPLETIVASYPTLEYNSDGKKVKEISNLYSLMYGDATLPKAKEEILLERKWRQWSDSVYVHMLSPNIYRTIGESYQAFHRLSKIANWEEIFSTWERFMVVHVGSWAMYLIGRRLKKRHNLKDDVRLSLYDETNVWLRGIKKRGSKFMGGDEPDLSDLAVYGSLLAIQGGKTFRDLVRNTQVEPWFSSMRELVDGHHGVKYLAQRGPNRQ